MTSTRALCLLAGLLALAVVPARAADDYEIGTGDVIKVSVIGQPELTGEFSVDSDGMMAFPILGKIKASEMSPKELERKITTLLADGYLRRPQVSVSIQEYKSQRVFVTGEVGKPGPYALRADRSLLALISDIGGFTASAGHEIVVIRPPAGSAGGPALPIASTVPPVADPTAAPPPTPEPGADPAVAGDAVPFAVPGAEVLRVSIQELQSGNPERNILLQAGDTVYVPRAAQVYVSGSVARPGPIRFQEGMTLLQALTMAGGVTERGSQSRARVVRLVAGKRQEAKLKPTDLVQPEDTIIVPERFF